MKVFVSWSGTLSKGIAKILRKRIPCIIQSTEIFFSEEDISKGEEWEKTISQHLSDSNYCIICLTSKNITAPWLNFEAGAIAKSFESRLSVLMIDINPSDIQGPLSRYQATKLEKDDFYKLITSINNNLEKPLNLEILERSFESQWPSLMDEANQCIKEHSSNRQNQPNKKNDPLEEILQLLRSQNLIIYNLNRLLYNNHSHYSDDDLLKRRNNQKMTTREYFFIEELNDYLNTVLDLINRSSNPKQLIGALNEINFDKLLKTTSKIYNLNTAELIDRIIRDDRIIQDGRIIRDDRIIQDDRIIRPRDSRINSSIKNDRD